MATTKLPPFYYLRFSVRAFYLLLFLLLCKGADGVYVVATGCCRCSHIVVCLLQCKVQKKSKLKCETPRQYDTHYLPVGGDKLEPR